MPGGGWRDVLRGLTQAEVHTLYESGPSAFCRIRDPSGT
jgi:hypothetical protein